MSDMNDKVALITGASSGIGRATAELFAEKGARIVVAARRQDELDSLVAAVEAGRRQRPVRFRPTFPISADVERMVEHAIKTFGRLDYAVNNAGIEGRFAPITDLAEDEWDQLMGINLKGTFLCMKHEAKAMLAGKHGGAIVNVGSVNSFLGAATGSAYCTSKHGLIGLTTSASAELAPQGIRVNLMCPGVIDTPMHRRLRDEIGDEVYDQGLLPNVHLRAPASRKRSPKPSSFCAPTRPVTSPARP